MLWLNPAKGTDRFNGIPYEKINKFNLGTLNLQTHFKEHIMFISFGSLVLILCKLLSSSVLKLVLHIVTKVL
jgi:hypothetical protein